MRSFRSFSFFIPAKAILVPGMYFFGFSRYSNYRESVASQSEERVVLVQECPLSTQCLSVCWHRCMRIQQRIQYDVQKLRGVQDQSCFLRPFLGCGIEHIGSVEPVRR
jgi:hypothetical protein